MLRPGGHLLFLEHVRCSDLRTARLQDRMNWLNRLMGVCCDCNRPTLDTIKEAGFAVTRVEPTTLPKAPPFVRPAIIGRAIPQPGDRGTRSGAVAEIGEALGQEPDLVEGHAAPVTGR